MEFEACLIICGSTVLIDAKSGYIVKSPLRRRVCTSTVSLRRNDRFENEDNGLKE